MIIWRSATFSVMAGFLPVYLCRASAPDASTDWTAVRESATVTMVASAGQGDKARYEDTAALLVC